MNYQETLNKNRKMNTVKNKVVYFNFNEDQFL